MVRALIVLTLSACAPEATPPPPDHGLLGSWRYVPARADVPVEQRQVLVFGADGRYSMTDSRSVEAGSFAIDDNEVTISSSASGEITTGYAVTEDRLIVDALFPAGDTDGLVGTWVGAQSTADATSVIELELRADGTGHLVQTGSSTDDIDATWIRVDPYAVITFDGVTRPRSFPALPGIAIGEWLYERIP
ncbi:MAG: hypothetical protein H0T42_16480 [Deltaproteobacteria bacterium]|nr:hypothetical protein [Deltaproteobacteria bacterium]